MRFTVRRPPTGEVSPCGHRPPGGDVACSVHVGVARPCGAGFALENRLALTISGSDVPARGASLRRVRGRDLLDPTVSLMLQTRGQQTPTAPADGPVKAALLGNAHARLLQVPRADRVIARTSRASIRIVSKRRAMSVVTFSIQSLRRSASHALISAIARFVRARRLEPRLARASRCCSTFNRLASPRVRPGTCNRSPVDSAADTATPRSIPTTLPSPGPVMGPGTWANAICQRPARSRVTR